MVEAMPLSFVGLSEAVRNRLEGEGLARMFSEFAAEHRLRHAQYIATRGPWFPAPVTVGTAPQEKIDALVTLITKDLSVLVHKGRVDNISVAWSDLRDLTEVQASAMQAIRNDFGVQGMSIRLAPKPHSVGLSVSSDSPDEKWKMRSSDLLWKGMLFGHKVHDMILSASGQAPRKVQLSENQTACLLMLARGKSIPAICEALSFSERKVLQILDKTQKKLEAHNHSHAVAKAIVLGLITA